MRRGGAIPIALLAGLALAQETPAPAVKEEQITGTLDLGYRWRLGAGGSQDVYRSLVNVGEGPKLFGAETSIRRPGGKLYDRIDVRASSWGGDPYNTARVDVARAGAYAFRLDYRNLTYFNSIPSFANPLLDQGVLFSQRSFDTTRRLIDAELELWPGARITPYLAYYRSSGFGRGVTTFVSDGNEFPVATRLRDSTDSYRGGLRLNLTRLNVTLEQGGTTFKDDQQVGFADGVNPGNRRTPILGQDILMRDLRQAYGARGDGIFSRAVVEARPFTRLNFSGQFLYSKPSIDVNYIQQNAGNFLLLSTLQIFTGQLDRSLGEASRPHSLGSWATEIRPVRRLRVIQSWLTDRFHISAGSLLGRTLTTAAGPIATEGAVSDRLVLNYNQHQVDAIVDVAAFLSLRGGHRYQWGDATARAPTLSPDARPAELRRHMALAGASVRLGSRIDGNVDLEAAAGDRTFFRTDLADYQRGKLRGRYRIAKSLTATGSFAILNNRTPALGVNLDYQSRQSALALYFTPNDGKRWSLLVDYTRATVRSSIQFLAPQDRVLELSRYRDDGHHGGASADVQVWRGSRVNLGGSFSVTAGSRPVRYYQPHVRAIVPARKRLIWTADWRWYGFDAPLYAFENFHTHVFATGLRIER